MTTLEEDYKIEERSLSDITKYGSTDQALRHLRAELDGYDSLWSSYSCDCLGHATTCTRLKIYWIERYEKSK